MSAVPVELNEPFGNDYDFMDTLCLLFELARIPVDILPRDLTDKQIKSIFAAVNLARLAAMRQTRLPDNLYNAICGLQKDILAVCENEERLTPIDQERAWNDPVYRQAANDSRSPRYRRISSFYDRLFPLLMKQFDIRLNEDIAKAAL